jgi:hypothetical protein
VRARYPLSLKGGAGERVRDTFNTSLAIHLIFPRPVDGFEDAIDIRQEELLEA